MSAIVGTPYYIAPEVLQKNYDKSWDLWSVGIIGYPPFNGNDYEEIKDAVLDGWYSFASKEWRNTSRDARDFIRNLLLIDPSLRMTAEEALHHPWVHNTNTEMKK